MFWKRLSLMLILVMVSFNTSIYLTLPYYQKLNDLFEPVKFEDPLQTKITVISSYFRISRELSRLIVEVAQDEGIDPYFFAALLYTESRFNPKAVSPKGYKGLGQIPWDIPYVKSQLVVSAEIYKEKYRIAQDPFLATRLYKGFPSWSPKAREHVRRVFVVKNSLHHYERLLSRELRDQYGKS